MDDLESKFSQILSDPAKLAEVMNMAQALMGQLGREPSPAAPAQAVFSAQEADASSLEPEQAAAPSIPPSVMAVLQQANNLDGKEAALFNALKPFLKPSRRERIDKAMRIARLSHLAGYALRNLDI